MSERLASLLPSVVIHSIGRITFHLTFITILRLWDTSKNVKLLHFLAEQNESESNEMK